MTVIFSKQTVEIPDDIALWAFMNRNKFGTMQFKSQRALLHLMQRGYEWEKMNENKKLAKEVRK